MNILDFDNFKIKRTKMVEEQLVSNGIVNKDLINAFLTVPRHEFVPDEYIHRAYQNTPLPIGYSQTISQPYVVAYMLQILNLESGHRVLEIGTGSGYQTAILCEIGCEVYTVELIDELSKSAENKLHILGYQNVKFKIGDGNYGFIEGSPYDRIVVSAASEQIPDNLIDQLNAQEGKIIIPMGKKSQRLILIKKTGNEIVRRNLTSVKFVPLINKEEETSY